MKKGIKAVLCLLASFVVFHAVPVLAAGSAQISMKAEKDSQDDKQLVVSCLLDQGDDITNGKLRIFYDEDKVSLLSSSAADVLSEAMCEINDCIDGNKPEGEMVVAFAASGTLPSGGSLLELKFKLNDGVAKGDEIHFEVRVEKLAGDGGDVEAKDSVLTYKAGEKGSQGSGDDGKNDDGKNDDKGDKKEPGGSKNTDKVKTGDDTPILIYALLGGAALLVVILFIVFKIRKKKD